MNRDRFEIPVGYVHRLNPDYYDDQPKVGTGRVWQPEVYALACQFALVGHRSVFDVGCGNGEKLLPMRKMGISVAGLDYGANASAARDRGLRCYDVDLSFPIQEDAWRSIGAWLNDGSVVVCADVIEHLVNPDHLLEILHCARSQGAVVMLSTPSRRHTKSPPNGPPLNKCHVREWNEEEFRAFLEKKNLRPDFLGLTVSDTRDMKCETILAVMGV